MNKKLSAILCLVGIVAASAALQAGKKFSYTLHGITFDASMEFSSPVKAGVDALNMVYPVKSEPGKEKIGITMVLYDRNAQKLMGMGDPGLLNYTRSVFMGAANPGKPVEWAIAGKKVKGQALDRKIPVHSTIEVYVITLKNGNKVGIGFNYIREMKDEARQVIAEIGASLRE